ncbi:MAG: hypothetical protein C0602_05810 [Denitrovibrio sp.]|nr:MAG: hypothetical protein C0602_05810 [Denitrovibrio sp.]
MLKSVKENFGVFFVIWIITLVVNQVVLFGACFKSYCIIAALPHTFVISLVLTYIFIKSNQNKDKRELVEVTRNSQHRQIQETNYLDNIYNKSPACPICNSKMVKRTAKQGKYAGKNFWGCSQFPNCRGTRNAE